MTTYETYHLIAYRADTGEEVLNWPQHSTSHHYMSGICPDVMEDGNRKWKVLGVRTTSTPSIREVEVQEVS